MNDGKNYLSTEAQENIQHYLTCIEREIVRDAGSLVSATLTLRIGGFYELTRYTLEVEGPVVSDLIPHYHTSDAAAG